MTVQFSAIFQNSPPIGPDLGSQISKAIDEHMPMVQPPEIGMGKRVSLAFVTKDENVIEIFAEATVKDRPSNPGDGYTEEDVRHFSGISVLKLGPLRHGMRRSIGEIVSFEDFFLKYPVSATVRLKMDRLMSNLIEQAAVSEKFLEQANSIWVNRDSGAICLPSHIYNC